MKSSIIDKLVKLADTFENKQNQFSKLSPTIDANNIKDYISNKLKTAVLNSGIIPKEMTYNLSIIVFVGYKTLTIESALSNITTSFLVNNKKLSEITLQDYSKETIKKYYYLQDAVTKYLSNNKELFPTKYNNQDVVYDQFHCVINF